MSKSISNFDVPWPNRNDRAFKEDVPWNPTVASLGNWITHPTVEALLPISYKEAADIVISHIEEGKIFGHPDIYFFPVAYLYRHAIELFLKKLIVYGTELGILVEDNELKSKMNRHELYPLWNKVCIVLQEIWPEGNKEDLKNVERVIQEFHNLDQSGQNFRYFKDLKGNATTKQFPVTVDLHNLKKTCDAIFSFFEGCEAGLSDAQT